MAIRLSDHFTYKKLLRFTLPSMVMMVFTSLYGVVDGLFVTNYAGKSALAAINFVFPVLMILSTFGYLWGAGGSALVAKTRGQGDEKKANSLFSLFVYISLGLGVIISFFGYLFLDDLMVLLGAEGEMLEGAVLYGRILLFTMPFWNLQFLFQIFFITAEKPKLGLYVTLLAGCTNMLLDWLFIGVFGWELTGAAVATALSQAVGGGMPLVYFAFKNSSALRLGKSQFDIKAILKAASNGSSELVAGVSGALVGILYNAQLMDHAGEDGVAAYGIMMYVSMVFVGIFFGYANGVAPVTGYHYGAENRAELKNLFKKSLILTISASFLMLLLSELLAVPLSLVFAGYDEYLYTLTLNGFRIYAISFLFSGVAIYGSSFFTSLNNGGVSAILSFARTVVFQVVCVLLFPIIWGIDGIWISLAVAEGLAVVVTAVFLLALRKKYHY